MAANLTWTQAGFGKYEEKTLPQIVLTDTDYFFWGMEKRIFRDIQDTEAEEIEYRACNIKIPKPDPENWRIEYYLTLDGKFGGFSVVEAKMPIVEPLHTITCDRIDLSFPRSMKTYDKLGNKMMIKSLKYHYFGGSNLTKERCENFFSNSQNFIWASEGKQTANPDSCSLEPFF